MPPGTPEAGSDDLALCRPPAPTSPPPTRVRPRGGRRQPDHGVGTGPRPRDAESTFTVRLGGDRTVGTATLSWLVRPLATLRDPGPPARRSLVTRWPRSLARRRDADDVAFGNTSADAVRLLSCRPPGAGPRNPRLAELPLTQLTARPGQRSAPGRVCVSSALWQHFSRDGSRPGSAGPVVRLSGLLAPLPSTHVHRGRRHRPSTVQIGTGPRTLVTHGGWAWQLGVVARAAPGDAGAVARHRLRPPRVGRERAPAADIGPRGVGRRSAVVLTGAASTGASLAAEVDGAMTCLQAVVERPERFLRGWCSWAACRRHLRRRWTPRIGPRTTRHYVAAFADACVPEPDSEHLRRWGVRSCSGADPEAAARLPSRPSTTTGTSRRTSAVTVPTLIGARRTDAVVPLGVGQAVAVAIADAEPW